MRVKKIILYSFGGILLLCICLYILLRSQPVQNYLIHKLSAYFSKELKTEIRIGGVNIGLRHIILENVSVNDRKNRPVLGIDELKLRIGGIRRKSKTIVLNNLTLNNAYINLRKYKNDSVFNYQFLIDYFSKKSTDRSQQSTTNKWNIIVKGLNIENSQVNYHIEDKPLVSKGMDYNNIDLSNLDLNIKDIRVIGDTIQCAVNNLQLTINNKQSVISSQQTAKNQNVGFALNGFSVKLKVTPQSIYANDFKIKTHSSNLDMNLHCNYKDYNDLNDFINKVAVVADIKPSKLNLNDIGYFLPAMYGMNEVVYISGDVSGKVSNLSSRLFSVKYGKSTEYKGYFSVKGLPEIENTYINFFSDKLSVSKSDIENFVLPSSVSNVHIAVPQYLSALGDIEIRGDFSGYYNDFIANVILITDIGTLKTDLTLKIKSEPRQGGNTVKSKQNEIEYTGNIIASNLDLGKLTSVKDLGKANLKVNVRGSGLNSKNLLVNLTGVIDTLYFKNYRYHNINLEGNLSKQKFEGSFRVKDENMHLDFDGKIDYSNQKPIMNFIANVHDANLNKLNLIKRDSLTNLSGLAQVDIEGNELDNLQGQINIKDTKYTEGKQEYTLNNLKFSATQKENNYKILKLNSDFVDADITGYFTFSKMYDSFINLMNAYLPSFYKVHIEKRKAKSEKVKAVSTENIAEQKFEYLIKLKKTSTLTKLMIPQLNIADSSEIKGKYNSIANTFTIKAGSSNIKLKRNRFADWYLDATASNGVLLMNIGCKSMFLSDSISLDNLNYGIVAKNDTLNYKLTWDNKLSKNNTMADISGLVSFHNAPKFFVDFNPSKIVVNDSAWNIEKGNKLIIDSSSVFVNNLDFIFKDEKIKFNGKISRNPYEKLDISFENFDVSNLDYFTNARDIDVDGVVNGNIAIRDLYKSPNLIALINIKNLVFDHDKLGQLNISSSYDSQKDAISADAELVYTGTAETVTPLKVNGYYYPSKTDNNFDFTIDADNIHLKWLETYLSGFASNLNGYATGRLRLTGPIAKPQLDGKMNVTRGKIKIDYLNTEYTFTGGIEINKNEIIFDDLILNGNNSIDPKNSKAILSGKIYHSFFSKMRLAMIIKLQNLACLNTTDAENSLYYGNAVASGTLRITGNPDNIIMDIDAKTEKGTVIFIPLNNPEELTDNSFVTFEQVQSSKFKVQSSNLKHKTLNFKHEYQVDLNGIQLNFNLEVNPNAEIQLVFDPRIGDVITSHGNGDIKLEINTNGNFNMYGDYVVQDGNYLFTLKKVINKRFTIVNGGKISWNGNPYEGTINLQAIYNVRTSVDILRPDLPATGKKISVDCNIFLKDNLLKPNVEFSITFPERTNDFSLEPYKAAIETDVNKQVFSLLALRSFTTPSSFAKGNEGLGASSSNPYLSNSTEMLFNQVSNLLSQINKDVDLGVKYHQGDQMTSDQVEVALGTQLLNERLLINGDFGVGGVTKQNTNNPVTPNSTSNSQIVGDVNIEYKITPDGHLRAKAFNKSNIYEYFDPSSPYTQGVGIFYRKDFDRFRDLFKSQKSKVKSQN